MIERAREAAVLARLHEQYSRQGYAFSLTPPQHLLPSFLGDFRPDAIALQGNGGIVIEIKRNRQDRDRPTLPEIARRFQGHPDWRFEILYTSDFDRSGLNPVPPERIEAAVRETNDLAATGHASAAFLLGWSALEAITRRLLPSDRPEARGPISPNELIEVLAREGLIDQPSARELRDLIDLRNSIVHGDLSVEVDESAIATILRILQGLLYEVQQ